MARSAQTQGVPRWNPYAIGEMRKLIAEELDKLTKDETYRENKLGAESYKEAKGRTNWNIYIYGELFERFTKRFDDTMRGTYTSMVQNMNANAATLNTITNQLKTLELNLNKYLKSSFENVLTNVVRNSTTLEEYKKGYQKSNAEIVKLTEGTRTDIRKATKILKESTVAELAKFKGELATNQNAFMTRFAEIELSLKENLEGLKTTATDVKDSVASAISTSNENIDSTLNALRSAIIDEIDEKLTIISGNQATFSNELTVTKNDLTELFEDKITKAQEAMNNLFEEQKNQLVGQTVAEMSVQLSEQSRVTKSNLESQAEKLAHRMENLNSRFDERLAQLAGALNQHLKELKSENDRILKTELDEIRTRLASIRADIEIMKTLLASIAR